MCITCDKLSEFKTNMSNAKYSEPYFPMLEVNKFVSTCCSEQHILFHCSYSSSKVINNMQSNGIFGPKNFLSTPETNEIGRYISNLLNELCHKNCCDLSNA
jgi:hypothetical protein